MDAASGYEKWSLWSRFLNLHFFLHGQQGEALSL